MLLKEIQTSSSLQWEQLSSYCEENLQEVMQRSEVIFGSLRAALNNQTVREKAVSFIEIFCKSLPRTSQSNEMFSKSEALAMISTLLSLYTICSASEHTTLESILDNVLSAVAVAPLPLIDMLLLALSQESGEEIQLRPTLKLLVAMVRTLPADTTDDQLSKMFSHLAQGLKSSKPLIRKEVANAIVALHGVVGSRLESQLQNLPVVQRRMITMNIARNLVLKA